ncbi:MAG: bifunctional phosphopantothenoylcysteine decarboxylase/phosphopantothenate--cysteine ligase CoaBC [Owenweeksia sp.]|nr:bifunctional phosphopantothenoylcysteine decarboxylase/phosphopantothenate--cysteine ligase CoaBC [Owenweeksia sp.]MBF98859.1 bifunctional phosphopantothenoylcysteine decarboxylase/phosphopantothenate--cysteine ligase CoaBC [Owenweeksia sp.]HBF22166.1 bifunctional phosphopantothenoylcysteine decarboxylase/phosphopantothenate--cysteine ligase CoaBC [Cryomorphaceae bacterium]|tara:strand:+ start:5418 stop:6626 length:1209 start_codon:yes stop_codon:yes gene_type:complete
MWRGKKVLLGVTGSIAAYKTTFLTRLLIKAGAEVKVVLSPAARDFVTPLTLATLSKNPVLWEYFDSEDDSGTWNNHVELALWADLIIIAPATSNTLGKMVSGTCDNLLLGVYMSAKCPIYFAPAMDLDMYRHPATRENIQKLQSFGHHFIPAGKGELASGLEGEGRMAEPEEIIAFVEEDMNIRSPLKGKKILINAGPTHEAIDPVRFIGNHSSGKMGVALAEQASALGAQVFLVLGPGSARPGDSTIEVHDVVSADEMNEACQEIFTNMDIAILSAAVADYKPAKKADQKIKKSGDNLEILLVENPDILRGLGERKSDGQVLVGFALETQNAVPNAIQKLHKKNCDLIVLNTPSEKGSGFGYDTNEVILIGRDEKTHTLELKSKSEIAKEILDHICNHLLA